MALINCPECMKEISDECKKCPQCGYKLKKGNFFNSFLSVFKENKEYSLFKGKFTISSMQILSLVALLCAFIISWCERCFSRRASTQLLAKSFYAPFFEHGGFLVLISCATIFMFIVSMVSVGLSTHKKLKKNILICLPNALLAFFMIITMGMVMFGFSNVKYAKGEAKFGILWGAIYVTLLVMSSLGLMVWNCFKNKKRKNVDSAIKMSGIDAVSDHTSTGPIRK